MDSFNFFSDKNIDIYSSETNKKQIIQRSYSRDGRSANLIHMKKFEIKLPNFNHVKIRDPSENFDFLIEKEKQNLNKKHCYCKYEVDELNLKEIFGSFNSENKLVANNQAEKIQEYNANKIQFDLEDAEKIKKILEEKEFVFKKHPEIFNSSYIKKYQKNKKLLYINFLKNKDVVYNYDKSSNTYYMSSEHKSLFDGNNLNDQEEKEFLVFLKENFSNMQSKKEINSNRKLIEKNLNNVNSSPVGSANKVLSDIKNGSQDKSEKSYLHENEKKFEIMDQNNINFSGNDNGKSVSMYDQYDKIRLQNKYLEDKNKVKHFAKKKQMQTVNLNENLVDNLNFEIAKINQSKSFNFYGDMQKERRPNSHNMFSLKKINFSNNNSLYIDFKNNQSKQNNKSGKDSISNVNHQELNSGKSLVGQENKNKQNINSDNLNSQIHRELNELNDAEHFEKGNKTSFSSKNKTKEGSPKIASPGANERKNINNINEAINNINIINMNTTNIKNYKTNNNKININELDEKAGKSRDTGSNTNSIDTKLMHNNNTNNKNELKTLLDENFKLAYDEKANRGDINFFNFHSGISTDRYGIFAKIEQKDFKDNFIRLKNHLEHNTIQNRILVSHKNHKSFTNNFFRKNKNMNNQEHNNDNPNLNPIKNPNKDSNPILKTEAKQDKNAAELIKQQQSAENLTESKSKILKEEALGQQDPNDLDDKKIFKNTNNLKYQVNIVTSGNLNEDYYLDCERRNSEEKILKDDKLNKDFCPVSRMLNTNYSWGDKLNSLKTPTSAYLSSREGLKTHCSLNDNATLHNYLKVYQKTAEDHRKKRQMPCKKSSTNEKYLFLFNSQFKEKDFNSKEKKEVFSDPEHKNLYSEGNAKKVKSGLKQKFINKENEKNFLKIQTDLVINNSEERSNHENYFNRNKKLDGSSKVLIKVDEDAILNLNSINKEGKKPVIPLKGFQNFDGERKNMKNNSNNNDKNNKANDENLNNDNSISYKNAQIQNIDSKKSLISNSNKQNSNYNINPLKHSNHEGAIQLKHFDSILNNSIDLNELYGKFDLKQSMKITSQNGRKNKVFCFEHQNAKEEILKSSHLKNPSVPRKSSKIQLFKQLIKTPPLPSALENFNQSLKTRKAFGFSASNTALNFYKDLENKKPKNHESNNFNFSSNNNINFEKISSVEQDNVRLRNELSNRYRKKKINIEEVLIMHNTNIRKQLNPVKTQDFHMKCSMQRKDKLFGLKRTAKQVCFNKSETYQLKRENLIIFEKPM